MPVVKVDGRTRRAKVIKELMRKHNCSWEVANSMLRESKIALSPTEPKRQLPEMTPDEILGYARTKKEDLQNRMRSLSDQMQAITVDIAAWDRLIESGEKSNGES